MREFILLDLCNQMSYLPRFMNTWSCERVLSWLRCCGEVHGFDDPLDERSQAYRISLAETGFPLEPKTDLYFFYAWSGTDTGFVLREGGVLFDFHSGVHAWT